MPIDTKNGARVPVGSDPYALTKDMKIAFESAGLVYPVPAKAVRDAIPAPSLGMTVRRMDLPGAPFDHWDGDKWVDGDSGWVAIPMINGWSNYANGFVALGCRRVGQLVQIRGTIKGGARGSNIGTLPPGFTPNVGEGASAFETTISAVQSGTWYAGSLTIYGGGSLKYDAPPGVWGGQDRCLINASYYL